MAFAVSSAAFPHRRRLRMTIFDEFSPLTIVFFSDLLLPFCHDSYLPPPVTTAARRRR
jgi:hypothetical protein